MDKNDKNIGGLMGGGIAVIALVMLIAVSFQNGAIKGLNGKSLVDIEPAAGEEIHPETKEHAMPAPITDCGVYDAWIGKPVDEALVEATGKIYRILPPGSLMTMDYNPERINVHLNEDGIVIDIKCG